MRLRVATQNLWGGAGAWERRRDLLLERLSREEPDVIALQEVRKIGEESQAHELARMLGDHSVHFAPAREEPGFCEGVALLARSELTLRGVERLTHDQTDPMEGRSQRVVLHALVSGFDVFVTHLSLSRLARARTTEEILAFTARARRGPSVLMGDMNATPDESIHARFSTSWRDAWIARHGARRGGTWPAILPFLRYDYVYVSADVTVEEAHRLPFAGSDHRGVIADLSFG
jgi:endonuclease/exonuclease/phosphatase family metal-dependent hydrolase